MSSELPPSQALLAIRAAAADGRCTNCEAPLPDPRPAFCPSCGQETRIAAPRLGEFFQQLGGAYFSTEGALWRTIKLLLLQPGELTCQYLAGRRRHHVLPLRLYLSISLVLLALVQWFGRGEVVQGLDQPHLASAVEKGDLPAAVLSLGDLKMGPRKGVFVCEGIPQLVCDVVQQRAAPDVRTFLKRLRAANERVVSHFGVVMFVLLPLFAGCLKIANPVRGMAYTAHLVFALHLHSFWFIVLAFMHLLEGPFVWIGIAAMAVYTLKAGRRVYGGAFWARIVRSIGLTIMYTVLLAVTVLVAWLLALVA